MLELFRPGRVWSLDLNPVACAAGGVARALELQDDALAAKGAIGAPASVSASVLPQPWDRILGPLFRQAALARRQRHDHTLF